MAHNFDVGWYIRIWSYMVYLGPHFKEGEVIGGQRSLFERAMVVSYRLSIVTIMLSLTIHPQFAIRYF